MAAHECMENSDGDIDGGLTGCGVRDSGFGVLDSGCRILCYIRLEAVLF